MQDAIGVLNSVDEIAHVIQIALTPVFLLSGIASLLSVFSSRLARVADRVHAVSDQLDNATPRRRIVLQRRLAFLQRRSHLLDAAVILSGVGGAATCMAAVLLFVGTLRDQAVVTALLCAFGFALLCTVGALSMFLIEMLMASRGLRDQVEAAQEDSELADAPDGPLGGTESSGAASP